MNSHLRFLYNWFSETDRYSQFPNIQFSQSTVVTVRQELQQLSQDIVQTDSFISKEIMRLRERLFNPFGVVPAVFGMTFGYITLLYEKQKQPLNDIWNYIHPKIQKVSKGQYLSGFYANAVENAFKEINARTKRIYANVCPNTPIPDGAAAMTKVYSSQKPIVEFCDRQTKSGQNTQLGFMEMAEGAMIALRDPVAHENLNISQADAMRQIMFASMIMYKIDEGVIYSGITE